MSEIIYLTKQGLAKLEEKLTHLKEVKRVEIAAKLKEAIEFWDLSENAEYEDARNEQAALELEISEIEEQLKHVEIIKEQKAKKTDVVNIGSTVKIESTSDKETYSYTIVGTTEADILDTKNPKISNDSPVWLALLGKKKSDVIKVSAPAGKSEYKILEIK